MPKDQKSAERAMRACSAALLNPLCERPTLLVSAQAGKLDDQLLEARRMIDLLGNPAAGYTLSNGEVTDELQGEFPSSLVASRTGFCSWLKKQVERGALHRQARARCGCGHPPAHRLHHRGRPTPHAHRRALGGLQARDGAVERGLGDG